MKGNSGIAEGNNAKISGFSRCIPEEIPVGIFNRIPRPTAEQIYGALPLFEFPNGSLEDYLKKPLEESMKESLKDFLKSSP